MRRGLLLIAVAAVAVLSVGCAQTDYPCITDVSQTGDGSTIDVNTNGQAHIAEFAQSALILTDGTTVEIVNFLNQKANSSGTVSDLYNYQYRTASTDFNFHTDQYCSPDSTSCSAATNTENEFCGADGKGGLKIASGPCSDGLFFLFGDIIRDSECGRAGVTDPMAQLGGLSILEAISMIADNSSLVEVDGVTWHEMILDPAITFTYDNGAIYDVGLPAGGVPARVRLTDNFQVQSLIDLSGVDMAPTLNQLQAIADENPGARFGISAQLFGYDLNLAGSFRLVDDELVPGFYADKAARLWGG